MLEVEEDGPSRFGGSAAKLDADVRGHEFRVGGCVPTGNAQASHSLRRSDSKNPQPQFKLTQHETNKREP